MLRTFFVFLALFIAHFSKAAEFSHWEAYVNPGFELKLGQFHDSIDGQSVIVIEAPLRDFEEVKSLTEINYTYFGFIDYLYLSQSVNCASFRNQHIHVSGYFRIDKSNIRKHLNYYKKWLRERAKEIEKKSPYTLPQIMRTYSQNRYDPLLDNHDIELYIFIHTDNGIHMSQSTGVEKKNVTEWQRLNVAIDVPFNCRMVTLSAYFKGTGSIHWDGFVVNPQGDKLELANSVPVRLHGHRKGNIEATLFKWSKKYRNHRTFANLSFEEFRK